MSFGIKYEKAKDARTTMSNPRANQRRESPGMAFEPIQARLLRKFPLRVARGDQKPIWGNTQYLPDGSPGGQPIPHFAPLMAPLQNFVMPPRTLGSNKSRTRLETSIQAARFLRKPSISLLQLGKPLSRDAAFSLRGRPAERFSGKPAPPVDFQGGFSRVRETNIAYPKDTSVSMQPVRPATGVRDWTSLPTFSEHLD